MRQSVATPAQEVDQPSIKRQDGRLIPIAQQSLLNYFLVSPLWPPTSQYCRGQITMSIAHVSNLESRTVNEESHLAAIDISTPT